MLFPRGTRPNKPQCARTKVNVQSKTQRKSTNYAKCHWHIGCAHSLPLYALDARCAVNRARMHTE
eukprot:73924-Alexandrium_andersonii.AAC.1